MRSFFYGECKMKKMMILLWLACGIALSPIVFAADDAPADQQSGQKAAADSKDGKAGESGENKEGKKGEDGAEPKCN